MKEQWMANVSQSSAQDVFIFVLFLIGVLAVSLWLESKK